MSSTPTGWNGPPIPGDFAPSPDGAVELEAGKPVLLKPRGAENQQASSLPRKERGELAS